MSQAGMVVKAQKMIEELRVQANMERVTVSESSRRFAREGGWVREREGLKERRREVKEGVCEGERDGEREGGREGEGERGREGGREGEREKGRKGVCEREREGGRVYGCEGGRVCGCVGVREGGEGEREERSMCVNELKTRDKKGCNGRE